jgi:hypothetical protein
LFGCVGANKYCHLGCYQEQGELRWSSVGGMSQTTTQQRPSRQTQPSRAYDHLYDTVSIGSTPSLAFQTELPNSTVDSRCMGGNTRWWADEVGRSDGGHGQWCAACVLVLFRVCQVTTRSATQSTSGASTSPCPQVLSMRGVVIPAQVGPMPGAEATHPAATLFPSAAGSFVE